MLKTGSGAQPGTTIKYWSNTAQALDFQPASLRLVEVICNVREAHHGQLLYPLFGLDLSLIKHRRRVERIRQIRNTRYAIRDIPLTESAAVDNGLGLKKDCLYLLAGDLNNDCKVGFPDFSAMAADWLIDCHKDPNNPACIPK